ncbi:MAG: DUF3089 domain-containing protein [Bacteroidetes bacterium]|nr:DUF3089 domain-containing protein [Bacteroidota bacterium]
MTPLRKITLFVIVPVLFSCGRPFMKFEAFTPPPEPDYSVESYWAALPWKKDSADAIPDKNLLRDNQENAAVDVFFIHPTTYFSSLGWNGDPRNRWLEKLTDKTTIRHQASAFNGSCRVFAPRYRQATVYSFLDNKGNGKKALALAYSDVKKAFLFYLDHYHKESPFIIASHSQGSYHARMLIQEIIEPDSSLRNRLIAAYLIGGPVVKTDFNTIQPCDSALQTGCYIQWNCVAWGLVPPKFTRILKNTPLGPMREQPPVCTNPLTWKTDTAFAPANLNLGGTPAFFNRIDSGLTCAKCSPGGFLWVKPSFRKGYPLMVSYHLLDYNLFYLNIRENVRERIDAYLRKDTFAPHSR